MKYIKMCVLLAVAASALMAFAGTASATTVTSSGGGTPTIEASSEGAIAFHNVSLGTTASCSESNLKGNTEGHGAAVTWTIRITIWIWNICNNHWTVLATGEWNIHGNGTVTSKGWRFTIQNTALGLSCIYETNETTIGTLTDTAETKGKATLDINSATIPRTGHSAFCGTNGQLTGSFVINSPAELNID